MIRLIVYDFETSKYDWLVVFKDYQSKKYTIIHNENDVFIDFIDCYKDYIFVGFNNKHYDRYIAQAIYQGMTPEEVKAVNDWIIGGNQGWGYPNLTKWIPMNQCDIMDDMQQGLSLKSIEGHLGMDIEETQVDFNLNRAWTQEELLLMTHYCKHDVDATEKITEIRWDYLMNKVHIGKLAGLSEAVALGMTNAKLTAAMLKAQPKPHHDERKYKYPSNLRMQWIPDDVFKFFDRMYDPNISDEDVFSGKLEFNIGDCPVTLGYGGIHSAVPNFMWKEGE